MKTTALVATAIATAPSTIAQPAPATTPPPDNGPFTLPPLPYGYDALEPSIDTQTMRIHHDKHHAGYVKNLNAAVADHPDLAKQSAEELLKNLNTVPEKVRTAVRNNGGGHYNHSLFWQMMKPGGSPDPTGQLDYAMTTDFGGFASCKQQFSEAASKVFGSGWVWLVLSGKELKIEATPNQDSPVSQGKAPLLGIDVWEHAYYLKYQNRRTDYIAAWWNVVNWDFVSERYLKARG